MLSAALSIRSGPHRLAGAIHRPSGPVRGSILVLHPHPAHGGDMDHPVVATAADRAAEHGLVAVRLDVRGVRESEGDVLDAQGHLDDLRAGHAAAAAAAPGLPAYGAGFSYGARLWMEALLAPLGPPVRGLLLLAPPTRVPRTSRDFGDLLLGRPVRDAARDPVTIARFERIPVPAQVLVGDRDGVAPPDELRRHAPPGATITVLAGLNHFFSREAGAGATDYATLVPALDAALRALLAEAP